MPATHTVELRDGAAVAIRPIEADDREAFKEGFERLSPESRYRRFFAPVPELSERDLDYLTQVDHRDHEALIAFDTDNGDAIGVARFIRSPDRADVAEAAVTVIDDWHGRGVGSALLHQLADRAREEDVDRFEFAVLAENKEMLDLIGHLGPVEVVDRSSGIVEFEVELPHADGAGPSLLAVLREAARQSLQVIARRIQPPGTRER